MKRVFVAAAIAVGLHALLLAVDLSAIGSAPLRPLPPSPVTLSLTYTEPVLPPPLSPPVRKVEKKREPPRVTNPHEPAPRFEPEPTKKRVSASEPTPPRDASPVESDASPPAPTPLPAETPRRIDAADAAPDASHRRIAAIPAQGQTPVEKPALLEAVPLYRKNPPPRYPRLARRRGYQGVVVLDVLVDREGRVRDLQIATSSGHRSLDRAALASVKGWSFEPGRRGSNPVKMWVRVPIRFQLE
jgi:periplasmic protein TonB